MDQFKPVELDRMFYLNDSTDQGVEKAKNKACSGRPC